MNVQNYFPKAWDIAGYTYNADNYCRTCMWEIAFGWNVDGFEASDTIENLLDRAATVWNINRGDESTFDSSDFPKVIFEGQICQEGCGDDSCDHEAAGCGHDTCGAGFGLGCGSRLCEQ